ncbi:MAG: SatD family protein [Bacteroidales bacterium]|nr:SatD family protein [Bacteroidales bacterium]
MADIIKSRSREGSELMKGFRYMVEETTVQYKSKFISPLTITLGDEFQSIVQSLQDGIDLIFLKDKKLTDYLNQLFFIYHSIISHWSRKDYEIIGYFMQLKDYKKVAEWAGRDVSSAWRKQKTLRMKEYFTVKNLIQSMTYESFE